MVILSKINKERSNVWLNKLKLKFDDSYNWVFKNHERIYKFILEHYNNMNSRRSHISTLASILRELGKIDLYEHYSKIAIQLQKKIEDEALDNQLIDSRKDLKITYNDVLQKRNEYKDLFMKDMNNKKLNFQYLILCLYTYQSPLRRDYVNMRIVTSIPKNKDNFFY